MHTHHTSWGVSSAETFVRAARAFIPFADHFDMCIVTTSVRGVGGIYHVKIVDRGNSFGYALEYNDEKGIWFLTYFLVVGEKSGMQYLDMDPIPTDGEDIQGRTEFDSGIRSSSSIHTLIKDAIPTDGKICNTQLNSGQMSKRKSMS